ncbi:hypothetical protein CBOM_02358 [Ceraceosorus bombacis]|uniref:Uncharacterized protein n=1 Tax=Ceraceosorus bombacis TaxID=401625 RepID=A0A0P1BER2_9BASI|nr:hypothetical protein CBOM_02358 [Ceraceosorus bombacis]
MSQHAGPSGSAAHRFQERRQERMRGAGTQRVEQRPFTFSKGPRASTRAATAARSSTAQKASSSSSARDAVQTPRRADADAPQAPLRSAMRGGREKAATARPSVALVGAAEQSMGDGEVHGTRRTIEGADRTAGASRRSSVNFIQSALKGRNQGLAASASQSNARAPTTSTPFRARVSSSTASSRSREDDEASVPSDEDDLLGGPETASFTADDQMPYIASPELDAHVDSPGVSAAARVMEARKRKRQASPGTVRKVQSQLSFSKASTRSAARAKGTAARKAETKGGRAKGRPPKSSKSRAPSRKELEAEDLDASLTAADLTLASARGQLAGASSNRSEPTAAERRAMKKKLRSVVRLALGSSKSKGGSAPTDVDVLWSIVERHLRDATDAQPQAPIAKALKTIRRSARTLFATLSERAMERSTLLRQLSTARRRKRILRKEVFDQRTELLETKREVDRLDKEERKVKEEAQRTERLKKYLADLRAASKEWT